MRLIFLLQCLLISASTQSCISNMQNNEPKFSSQKSAESPKSNNIIMPPPSGIVNIQIKNGEGSARIYKKKDQIIYIVFNSDNYNQLSGQLIPLESDANIRFSQIILPDGNMDGPFGRELTYKLPTNGEYKLFLHEDMMAGDPWAGEFLIKLNLSTK